MDVFCDSRVKTVDRPTPHRYLVEVTMWDTPELRFDDVVSSPSTPIIDPKTATAGVMAVGTGVGSAFRADDSLNGLVVVKGVVVRVLVS